MWRQLTPLPPCRQQWTVAAALKPQTPSNYPWQINPAMEAITYFANGLGAAHTGDAIAASRAIDRLKALEEKAAKTSDYWAKQIEIQRLAVAAWSAYGKGDKQAGLTTMHNAAALEAATEKHPVTPGEVLPAHELLADMLFDMGRYEEALANYQAALKRSPNRLNSLYGAGRSAELAGQKEMATGFYGKLVKMAAADATLERLQEARSFLSGR
jgi:tetratricopeptide (TPR) repeat protein